MPVCLWGAFPLSLPHGANVTVLLPVREQGYLHELFLLLQVE